MSLTVIVTLMVHDMGTYTSPILNAGTKLHHSSTFYPKTLKVLACGRMKVACSADMLNH